MKSYSKRIEPDDGIAEDVRKIKESMKETQPTTSASTASASSTSARKGRTPAKPSPKVTKSRASKREKEKIEVESKIEEISSPKAKIVEVDKPKINADELKNELLADWLDEDETATEKDKTVINGNEDL